MAERYIPEHRRTQFKARGQFKPDELRRRREEQQVEIRKQKREDNLAKRRGIQTRDGGISVGGVNAATESDDEASAIESEVCFENFPSALEFSFLLSIEIGLLSDRGVVATLWVLFDSFVFMMRSSTRNFFHRPVAMAHEAPPNLGLLAHAPL
jgi:hypothetical protein